jgi:5'-3' exonuclease
MIALIDGDILVYRVGHTTNNEPEWIARARLRETIEGILRKTDANDYEIWLSDTGNNNFRSKLFPRYKANRTQPKPTHYEYIQNLLLEKWQAEVAYGQEADDSLGIRQVLLGSNSIICTIDKDLKQIPGKHFNFVKDEWDEVTPWRGMYVFYNQCLTGDSTDNIRVVEGLSCKGVGPERAYLALEGCETERDLFTTVRDLYRASWEVSPDEKLLMTGQLVKIRTKPDELWHFPIE